MIVTYAFYEHYPIACMGDDPMTDSIICETDDPDRTRVELEEQHGGYVQIWNIDG